MRSQLFSYTFVPPGSFHRHTGLDRLYKEKVQVEIMIPVSTIQYGKNRFLRLIYQSGFEGSFAVMDP